MPGTGVDAPRAWDNLIAAGRPGGRGVTDRGRGSGVAYERSPDCRRFASRGVMTSARAKGRGDERVHRARPRRRRRVRARDAHREHDRRVDEQRQGADRARVRRDDHPGQGAQRLRRRRGGRRSPTGSGTPPTAARTSSTWRSSSARRPSRPSRSRGSRRRCATRAPRARWSSAPPATRPSTRVAYPGRAARGRLGRRRDRALLPGRVLQHRRRASTSWRPAAARTRRCSAASPAACRTGRTGARSCSSRSRARQAFRYTTQLQGHVDGGGARLGHGRADHRLGRARPEADGQAIEVRLKTTARDLGRPGKDLQYGAGLIDAGAATAPPPRANRGA